MFKIADFQTSSNRTYRYASGVHLADAGYKDRLNLGGQIEQFQVVSVVDTKIEAGLEPIEVRTIDGKVLIPAKNPPTIEPGEYLFNPYDQSIKFHASLSGAIVRIKTRQSHQKAATVLYGVEDPLLSNLPVTGRLTINRGFESPPSASLSGKVKGYRRSQILAWLLPGTFVRLMGLPLQITQINCEEIAESASGELSVEINISFGSEWAYKLSRPVFIRDDNITAPSPEKFLDPQCLSPSGLRKNQRQVEIPYFLNKAGVPYIGPRLEHYTREINTPARSTLIPNSLISGDRPLIVGGFPYFSNLSGIEIRKLDGVKIHTYYPNQIIGNVSSSYDSISPNHSLRNMVYYPKLAMEISQRHYPITPEPLAILSEPESPLGFEYRNAELSGDFNDPQKIDPPEHTMRSQPRYVLIEQKSERKVEGDENAHLPLEGVRTIQVMSLCFDLGGQTRERTISYYQGGVEMFAVEEKYGFAFRAIDIYDDARKKLSGNPLEYWQLIRSIRRDFIYHNTGYLLAVLESGFSLGRFRQESQDQPETLRLKTSSPEWRLFQFQRVPVVQRTTNKLKYLSDVDQPADSFELYKKCNQDGTSEWAVLANPDYAPPYYNLQSRIESNSFASTPNPANARVTGDKKRMPDLVYGEESRFERTTYYTPPEYQYIYTNEGAIRGPEIKPPETKTFIYSFKAQGESIGSGREESQTEKSSGFPPLATRRPNLYRREEVTPGAAKNLLGKKEKPETYIYYLQTPGYTLANPSEGSESFPHADTYEKAITAAKSKCQIENYRSGLQESLKIAANLAIEEGDRFNYYLNGEFRQRVVLGISAEFLILRDQENRPILQGTYNLSLGRYRTPVVNCKKVLQPKPPGQEVNVTSLNVISGEIGYTLPWFDIRSRRNP